MNRFAFGRARMEEVAVGLYKIQHKTVNVHGTDLQSLVNRCRINTCIITN